MPGTVVLHLLDQRQGDSSLFDFSDDQLAFAGDRLTKVEVPATSLDAYFGTAIDLIRMDVEGAEPLVFDGMRHILERNPRVKIMLDLFLERTRRWGRPPAKFLESIQAMGFRIQTAGPRGRLQQLPIDILAEWRLSESFLSRKRRLLL